MKSLWLVGRWVIGVLVMLGVVQGEILVGTNQTPETWRAEKRLIDLHLHINSTAEHLARAVRIMDEVGSGVGVNLSGGSCCLGLVLPIMTAVWGKSGKCMR